MKNINLDMDDVQISVNYIITELTKHITNTAKDLEHLQKQVQMCRLAVLAAQILCRP